MGDMTPVASLALSVFSMVATAGAVYGAIKADLRAMHETVETLRADLNYQRARIDSMSNRPQFDRRALP